MRQLTKNFCLGLRRKKLQEYKLKLKKEKAGFLVEKAEKLEFIRQEEIACGREPTVTEEEIAAAKMEADKYQNKSRSPEASK